MLSRAVRYRPVILSMSNRLQQMASHIKNGVATNSTLRDLPKSNVFTSKLPADPAFPTPRDSHNAPRETLGPRMVKESLYTFVRPENVLSPELVAISEQAMKDLGLDMSEKDNEEFKQTLAGNMIISWNEETGEGIYPWAQCYGGYQFGQWAGQLGDGRAISLFETKNPETGVRYELQLKGAGKTPYSRFADGKAVLRSSIREFVVSEYLNAIGIPTTRALSLIHCPRTKVQRERLEPGAIVARFAQSWIRLGTFDLPRARGDRKLIRQLATYVAENVFDGWESLPSKLPPGKVEDTVESVSRGALASDIQGEGVEEENRFTRLYREIARRNAKTVAAWQAYGFMNGVLNTDNTSVLGLSIDFGPFAFLDAFDPMYTPNHDDHMLRYSYRNQPTIIWWNLVRLGEALGELIGAGAGCDEEKFVSEGVEKDKADELVERAEHIITAVGEEYKAVFMSEYKKLMTARLGLKIFKESDFNELFSEWLDTMEDLGLDFHHSFRRLGSFKLAELANEEMRKDAAGRLLPKEGLATKDKEGRERIAKWLEKWVIRVKEDWGDDDAVDNDRTEAMRKVNPKFIPRGWILEELIERVEKKGERDIIHRVMDMTLAPFNERWDWDETEEERLCGDVPKYRGMLQCSCSS